MINDTFIIGLAILLMCAFHIDSYHFHLKLQTKLFRTSALPATVALVANGKRLEVESGTSMMAACLKLGLKVPTDCKKGDCGTCTVTVGGNKIRACIGKVPSPPKLKSVQEKGLAVTVDN